MKLTEIRQEGSLNHSTHITGNFSGGPGSLEWECFHCQLVALST